jgi:hypothetical protein
MRSSHLTALFGAATAFLRAPSAVIHRVLRALGAARFANFGADAANVVHEMRTPAHECRRGPADVGAVAIQADAIGQSWRCLVRSSRPPNSVRIPERSERTPRCTIDVRGDSRVPPQQRSSPEGNVLIIPCRTSANPPIHTVSATSRCPCPSTRELRWTYRSPAEKPAAASN